jgi:hypothetical protein
MKLAIVAQMTKHQRWLHAMEFLKWEKDVLSRPDFDSYLDEIHNKEEALGITEKDRADYREMVEHASEPCPF